ncbi:4,5-dihydroxyphthalate decarboxylase [Bacillus sp. BRMEA1]|uniref:4,5-dihydroxyphthalate decarboxylase n=1 Tax=Neobacillus endophyticus TaxID=2738405 RepID=UPI00156631A0|nr:4,5-dihydroxyphthalate decarboxylase [Neobacillus endophyticus]NRD80892.1 4,5-dihydroxyphthalate decarboxylase [Neobacillus endophyticus]
MNNIKLNVGAWKYFHTEALLDGTVKIEGVDASFESGKIISDIFERMVRDKAYDVAELGLTFYLRMLEQGDTSFIALPIFPNRQFRHSAIFINTASGIEKPEDLAGKTIGEFGLYGHDAGVWPKGILSDDFGVKPEQSRWIIGASDWYMPPFDFVPQPHPDDVDVRPVPKGKALGTMLENGEIDAFISAHAPTCIVNGSPKVARLFPDYESVERDYYQRTGIFPIMHTVVIRKDLLEKHLDLAQAVYRAFCESKDIAMEKYRTQTVRQNMEAMMPWFTPLFEKNRQLMGDDWWPYGIEANRKTLDTFLRYFYEQGLSKHLWTCEEIFVPELFRT